MNIYEISEKHKISLHKLRAMDKDNLLRLDTVEDERSATVRHYLSRNTNATVEQLLWLIEAPAMIVDLGRHANAARLQVAALGDVKATAAPRDVTAYVDDAARGDPDAMAIIVRWLQGVLPAKPVGYAWVATRLLIGLPENLRAFNVKRIPMALLNIKGMPEFAGWWSLAPSGGATDRNQTFYMRPKRLDL